MENLLFNIQKYCLHDGPGIRTVIFLKGCHLKCRWCCNPESQSFGQELIYKEITCIKCGTCIKCCPNEVFTICNDRLEINRTRCSFCGKCIENCCTKSLEISGSKINFDKIIEEVLKDKSYYDMSNGGVTLSGGEPLAQKNSCKEILTRLKRENIHTAVETSGYVDTQTIVEMLPLIDLFLFDIKHPDPHVHISGTGKDNKLILDNLRILTSAGATIVIRYPFIPGFNSDEDTIKEVANIMTSLGLNEIDILPFHRLGSEKYKHLGLKFEMSELIPPEHEILLNAKNILLEKGISNVTVYR
ncbi:MAG TPA: glycyl-radical enzyme activating protein [Peptococcaceae bacterium]|nr:glycyl-radical enzyme activating protein [Peptococcaceae bacterium]